MPIQKRLALLEWIQNRDGLIIEDDYDSELRYFGRPIPSMQGLDGGHSVVYVGSFSKLLLPALRISYMVLPPKLMPVLQQKIAFYNQTASLVEQLTVAHFMADGQLHKQIRKTRKIYARKNQLLLEQLHASPFPPFPTSGWIRVAIWPVRSCSIMATVSLRIKSSSFER